MKSNRFLFFLTILFPALAVGIDASTLANNEGIERWRVAELTFQSATDYSTTGAATVEMDVAFTHTATGTVIKSEKPFRLQARLSPAGDTYTKAGCRDISCSLLSFFPVVFLSVTPLSFYFAVNSSSSVARGSS